MSMLRAWASSTTSNRYSNTRPRETGGAVLGDHAQRHPARCREIPARTPIEIRIQSKTSTVDTITQRYWQVTGVHKLDALTRMLEVEEFDGMLIFVRTKSATVELAEKLEARGFFLRRIEWRHDADTA